MDDWVDVFEFMNDVAKPREPVDPSIYDPVRKIRCAIVRPKRFYRMKWESICVKILMRERWEKIVVRIVKKTTLMRKIFWKLIWVKVTRA
jgi:hypothetical protein